MRRSLIRLSAACLMLGATAAPALAQVFSSEFFAEPVSEGWELVLSVLLAANLE